MQQKQAEKNAQTELFGPFQDASRRWLDRVQAETNMTSELAAKLGAARSLPEVIAAYQEWGNRHFQLLGEDTVNLFDNTQRLIQSGARVFLNGWPSQGTGIST